eukprot:851821-Pyramimonas_sp.AAC.1
MAFLKGLTFQELAEATGEKERAARVYIAARIGHSAPNSPRIRALRRVKALSTAHETRDRHQRRSTGFLT